jgi:hypothetical protein
MEEGKMIITSKIMAIGITIFSITIGIFAFYIISDLSKDRRKEIIEEIISQFIHFILFIWIGKIILNFTVFIKDPLAILAYPSSSNALYIAILISIFTNMIKSKKGKMDYDTLIISMMSVFLVASFFYEFIHLVILNDTFGFHYFVIICILLLVFFFTHGSFGKTKSILFIITGWSAGLIILSFFQPVITVFGYMFEPWFVILFFIISYFLIKIKKEKRDSNEWD